MKKSNLIEFVKAAQITVKKHSPEILTGIGVAGMVTTTILAVNATPKALRLLNEAEEEKKEPLTRTEVVKTAWKPYIPAVLTGTLSIGCLIGAQSVSVRRLTAVSTAYKLSETALTEYREKVAETIGKKKEKTVREKVIKEKMDKNPASSSKVIVTDKGETLCYDAIFDRYFKSDHDRIRKAENIINKQLIDEGYVSLNDFFGELGLGYTTLGNELGWALEDGLINLELSSQLTDDGKPALVVDYNIAPKYDYSKFA